MTITITERGWPGHFICARRCTFRRNTLIAKAKDKKVTTIVVSTVGDMKNDGITENIGYNRDYETMVFRGKEEGHYIEADVTKELNYHNEDMKWFIKITEYNKNFRDNLANAMHDDIVKFYVKLLENDELN